MALFKKIKEKTGPEEAAPRAKRAVKTPRTKNTPAAVPATSSRGGNVSYVLMKPRITEKASRLMEGSAYAFNVSERANKQQIAQAIREQYGVMPRQIRIVPIMSKTRFKGGHRGRTAHGKKAYVFLKKGEKIEVV